MAHNHNGFAIAVGSRPKDCEFETKVTITDFQDFLDISKKGSIS